MSRRPSDGGFSLVEIIVSLALLAMILLLVPGALRTGKRGWETTDALQRSAAARASLDFIRQRLGEAMPVYDKDAAGGVRIAFSGGPDNLSFVAPAPNGPYGGGVYRIGLAARATDSGGPAELTLSMSPYRPEASTDRTRTATRALAENVELFRVRYFAPPQEEGDSGWADSWQRPDRLPDLIELQLTSRDPGVGALPRLRVELKLTPRP